MVNDPDAGVNIPLITVYCCREWVVFDYYPLRPCGLCGEVPHRL